MSEQEVEGRVFEFAAYRPQEDDTIEMPAVEAGTGSDVVLQGVIMGDGAPTVRRDVAPAWLRSPAAARSEAAWHIGHACHLVTFHGVRAPFYWARLTCRAHAGAWRIIQPVGMWVWAADERAAVKAHARVLPVKVNPSDPYYDPAAEARHTARKQARTRGLQRRVGAVMLAVALIGFAVAAIAQTSPLVQLAAAAVVLALLGRVASKPEQPIVATSAATTERNPRLTAEVVVTALASLKIAGLEQAIRNNPAAIQFHAPPARTGTGYRADFDLPPGFVASSVVDKRAELSSAMGRQLGCVWPAGDPDSHEGRVILTVLDVPLNKAKAVAWPLAKTGRVNLFDPFVIGTDQAGQPVEVCLMYQSVLIGAMPGFGKSVALRVLLLAAALDDRVEMHTYGFKGADLAALKARSVRYRSGGSVENIAALLDGVLALQQDVDRRYRTMEALSVELCPDGKVTDELASDPVLGLHPVILACDEIQVALAHPEHGPKIAEVLEDLMKRGRACGVIVILATQRPDRDSLPKGISSNAGIRLCFRVMSHVENDMVLGTGAFVKGYKATLFGPRDLGVAWLSGHADAPTIVKVSHVNAQQAAKIAARAGIARPVLAVEAAPVVERGILDHLESVWPQGQGKVWFEVLAHELGAAFPRYEGWSVERLSAEVASYGLVPCQIKRSVGGVATNRNGLAWVDVERALGGREDAP